MVDRVWEFRRRVAAEGARSPLTRDYLEALAFQYGVREALDGMDDARFAGWLDTFARPRGGPDEPGPSEREMLVDALARLGRIEARLDAADSGAEVDWLRSANARLAGALRDLRDRLREGGLSRDEETGLAMRADSTLAEWSSP